MDSALIDIAKQRTRVLFQRSRHNFRKEDISLGDKDSHESYAESIRQGDGKIGEKKLMMDFSCDVPPRHDCGTGPDPVTLVHYGIQTQPLEFTHSEADSKFNSEEMAKFIKENESDLESSLDQNLLCDIFLDEFAKFPQDDQAVGKRGDKTMRTFGQYDNYQFTKDKITTSVEFQPVFHGKKSTDKEHVGLVLQCLVDTSSHQSNPQHRSEEEKSNVYKRSFALIWNPPDPAPIFALEASSQINVGRFHPIRPTIIIAGTANGQVVMWDLKQSIEKIREKGARIEGFQSIGTQTAQSSDQTKQKDKQQQGQQQIGSGGGGTALLIAIAQLSAGNFNISMRDSGIVEEENNGLPLNSKLNPELVDQNEIGGGIIFVQPARVSSIEAGKVKERELEAGHGGKGQAGVIDIRWLDASKFLSIGGDGTVKLWDIYCTFKQIGVFMGTGSPPIINYLPFKAITAFHYDRDFQDKGAKGPGGRKEAIAGSIVQSGPIASSNAPSFQITHQQLLMLDKQTEYPPLPTEVWFPLFTEPRFQVDGMTFASPTQLLPISGSNVLIGTDKGEFVKGELYGALKEHKTGGAATEDKGSGDKGGQQGGKEKGAATGGFAQVIIHPHYSPIVAVERHPLYDGLTLVAGGSDFSVWRDGLTIPLVQSPPFSTSQITAAVWSPTRASVIILARQGGVVEVWSIIERLSDCVLSHSFAPHTIVSINVSPPIPSSDSRDTQFISLGDTGGRLVLVEMPRSLSAPSHTERRMFDLFVEHETNRISSQQKRQEDDKLSGKGGQSQQKQKGGSGEKEKQRDTGPQGPPPRLSSGQQSGYGGAKKQQQDTRPQPKQRDQQGQYNYTDEDETMWEYLGNVDRATEPNKIDINFFENFSELEEKIEREKKENEKLIKK